MKFKTNLRVKSAIIDPVPFINLFLLFVIFIALSMQFIGTSGLVVDVPSIEQAELYKIDNITVYIMNDGIFLHNRKVTLDELGEELLKQKSRLLAIRAEKNTPHSIVAEIISMAKRSGVRQIAMAADIENKQSH